MVDPALSIGLAGVVLAIALTFHYSRPAAGLPRGREIQAGEVEGDVSDRHCGCLPRLAAVREADHQLVSLLPPGFHLFRHVPRAEADCRDRMPDGLAAQAMICDASLRPVAVLGPPGPAGCGLPHVIIPPGADRGAVTATLASIMSDMKSPEATD